MKFFEDQRRAKRETYKLLLIFYTITILTAFATAFVCCYFIISNKGYGAIFLSTKAADGLPFVLNVAQSHLFIKTFIGVCLFILLVSYYRMFTISGDGAKVAYMVGAKPFNRDSVRNERNNDPKLFQFLNVVEEMSIASGIAVPQAYILERDLSINAFVAGDSINNSIICVTEGSLKKLNRDELQGLVAHEFGHIFNGDMMINIKLLGYIAGLTSIYRLGRFCLDLFGNSRRYGSRSSRDKNGAGAFGMFGLALMIVGGIGMLLARYMQSLISQTREFLADASSVQYTRNPNGIGNVLKKIWVSDSLFQDSTYLDEISHFCISQVSTRKFFSFDTHPPITKRLQAIFPRINLNKEKAKAIEEFSKVNQYNRNQSEFEKVDTFNEQDGDDFVMGAAVLYSANSPLANIPERLNEQVNSQAPELIIFSYILNAQKDQTMVLAMLHEKYNSIQIKMIQQSAQDLSNSKDHSFTTVLELLIPKLKQREKQENKKFLLFLKDLIEADKEISLEEVLIYIYARCYLFPFKSKNSTAGFSLNHPTSVTISMFLYQSIKDNKLRGKTFNKINSLNYAGRLKLLKLGQLNNKILIKSLQTLAKAPALKKDKLIESLIIAARADQKLQIHEWDLLCVFAQALGVPSQFLKERYEMD